MGEELRETSAALRQAEGERNSLAKQLQSLETSLEEERVLALIDNVSVEAFLARAKDLIASNKMSDSPVFTAGLTVIGQSLIRSEQNPALRNAVATLEGHTTQEAIYSIRLTIAQQNGSPSQSASTMVRAVVDKLRVAIFETRGSLTSTEAQIEHARAQVEWLEKRMASLRSELSEVRVMATDLHRDVELANEAYTSLARLEPLVRFFSELTPGNARMLNTAFVPEEADKRSRLTATAIAIIVTGLLVIMFAFLREAVRDPQETVVLERA